MFGGYFHWKRNVDMLTNIWSLRVREVNLTISQNMVNMATFLLQCRIIPLIMYDMGCWYVYLRQKKSFFFYLICIK